MEIGNDGNLRQRYHNEADSLYLFESSTIFSFRGRPNSSFAG